MDSRLILAIALAFGFLLFYQQVVLKRLYPPPAHKAPATVKASPGGTPQTGPGAEAAARAATSALPSAAVPAAAVRTVEVETNLYDAQFTTAGGRLKSFKLKRYHQTAAPNSPYYQMVRALPGERLPLGLVVDTASGQSWDDRSLIYRTSSPDYLKAFPGHPATLTLAGRTADGLSITKSFTFRDSSYVFDVSAAVAGPKPSRIGLTLNQPLAQLPGYRDYPEVQALVGGKALTEMEKALRKGVVPVEGKITYAGFGDRYFLTAVLPGETTPATLAMGFAGGEANVRLLFSGQDRLSAGFYLGPKEVDVLEAVNPQLSRAIDFGWTGWFALPFLRGLKLIHRLTPNWGVDIILFTVLLRLLMLPLSIKSQRSMIRLQRLQPQVQRIRDKFKDDTERLNREMMDLYKRNHVNPLGGCLPTAIQFPIFIGLYEALLNTAELRHAPFALWIRDLSAPDCFPVSWMPRLPLMSCRGIPVLVLMMGLSTYVQQWMSPAAPDPTQQRMMMLMPIMFTVLLVNFPAGLSLYYFASNVLGIIQQFILNREFKQAVPVSV